MLRTEEESGVGRYTVFNCLAYAISSLPDSRVRQTVSLLPHITDERARIYGEDMRQVEADIMISSGNRYIFTQTQAKHFDALIHTYLARQDYTGLVLICQTIDTALGRFFDVFARMEFSRPSWKTTFLLEPLNDNYESTGLKIYPVVRPFWSLEKAVAARTQNINCLMENYRMLSREDERTLKVRFYYMKSDIFGRQIEEAGGLSVALSPVLQNAGFHFSSRSLEGYRKIHLHRLEHRDVVNTKITATFSHAFERGANIIAFPELLGTKELIGTIQQIMRTRPEQATIGVMPTYYENGYNKAVILGPGGEHLFTQNKIAAFHMHQKERSTQEEMRLGTQINILLLEGLGALVAPICADILDGDYERIIYDLVPANTIICPSFSPGINAFYETMVRGVSTRAVSFWLNTCSAEIERWFPGNYGFDPVAFVQLPDGIKRGTVFHHCRKLCGGECSESICYFYILIQYVNRRFLIRSQHEIA